MNYQSYLDAIFKALGDKIGTEVSSLDIEAEFETLLEKGTPPEAAVRKVLRDHGIIAPTVGMVAAVLPIKQLPPNGGNVSVHVRVLSISKRTVNARGEEKEIVTGLLGDETGTVPYTSWRNLDGVEKGDVIQIQNAYTKEFRNEVSLNLGTNTRIQKVEKDTIGVVPTEFKKMEIGELSERSRFFELNARVLSVTPRTVMVQGAEKTIFGGELADESGRIEYTAWADLGLKEGQALQIRGAYAKTFRNNLSISLDEKCTLTPIEGKLPSADVLDVLLPSTVAEVLGGKNRRDCLIHATILEVRDGSGLVHRCPTENCNRVIQSGECFEHGAQTGTPDVRIKAIIDDGTESLQVIIGREFTLQLLGMTLEQAVEEARSSLRPEIIQDLLKESVEGRQFAIRGFVREDDYGALMITRELTPLEDHSEAEATELLAEWGEA